MTPKKPKRRVRKPRTTEVCILRCECCGEFAVAVGGKRITDNISGGQWKVVLEQVVPLARFDWAEEAKRD